MAKTNSKARARAYTPFWLIHEPQLPQDPEQARRHIDLMGVTGTALAMCVIRNLLRRDEVSRRAKRAYDLLPVGSQSFSPTQVEGLRAALYFLRRHSDGLLQAERNR